MNQFRFTIIVALCMFVVGVITGFFFCLAVNS
jgi:hypothetical protein